MIRQDRPNLARKIETACRDRRFLAIGVSRGSGNPDDKGDRGEKGDWLRPT